MQFIARRYHTRIRNNGATQKDVNKIVVKLTVNTGGKNVFLQFVFKSVQEE